MDSPRLAKDPWLDITDLYVFHGDEGKVFVMNVKPETASGYHPEARYEFKPDTDGDAVENLVYRFTFDSPDESGRQRLALRVPPESERFLGHG
ncbi:DUF4331 domain-containing protein [Actinoplanes sp. TBRC 11911]|nr:DUF4331 domain-containing protein [Actinoplanes sp. TBRC 11911]